MYGCKQTRLALSDSPVVRHVLTGKRLSSQWALRPVQTNATCANMLGRTCCVRLYTMLGYVA